MPTVIKYFLLNILIFLSVVLKAQENTFNGGISSGFTLSQIAGDGIGGFDKLGVTEGIYIYTEFKENNFLQLEMNYIQKGSKKMPSKWNPSVWSIRLNYVEMPLIYKRKYKKLYYQVGLNYGRLINQKFISLYLKDNDIFYKYEVGYNFGISYHLTQNLLFETRYSRSLLPVGDETIVVTGVGLLGGYFNTVLQFALKLNIGGKSE